MNLKYIIKEGFAGIKRAKVAATTSIFSLFIAILLLGILSRFSYNIYMQAMTIKDLIEVEVYLFDVDDQTQQDIARSLNNESMVDAVTFISKDSASAVMKREFGPGVEELVELNFLPASFRLKISADAEVDQVQNLVSRIRNLRGVDEVEYNEGLLKVMETNLNMFTLIGGGLGLLILLAALILVYNTIRLTIYAKRELIRAMKLVGATNSFIRSPFIVEGILQGILAGVLAVSAVFFIFEMVIPFYLPEMGILQWPFGRWYFLIGAMFLLSVIMGWWGSRLAARKFIEETYISG
ncbi:MAG TPA: ABC transporter permease [Balneolaceae bacterium]|mgnify:CR=1 FL=1|nr:ABC transporter permease [Balneolaceae bacterium]|tara:strand:- start:223067 stop:223951 length:885 start_codon:yes stop_codon:yes gene_type:complete